MSNKIILYPNCKILPWKNFSVDDLASYLATLTPAKNFDTTQYVKHALELTYKLDLSQSELDFNIFSVHNYNYLMAENNYGVFLGGIKVYYFIINKKWISNTCIEFSLKMDTINTFKNLDISAKTTILRQHKNRWATGSDLGLYKPLIDLYSENLQPLLFKTNEYTLYEQDNNEYVSGSFYLIYRSHTTDEDSPIDILLCGDSPISVNVGSIGGYFGEVRYKDMDDRASYGGDMLIYAGDTPSNTGISVSFIVWTSNKDRITKTWNLTANNQALYLSSKYCAKGLITGSGFVVQESITYTSFNNREMNNFDFKGLVGVKCIRQVSSSTSLSDLTSAYISGLHKMSMIDNYLGTNDVMQPISEVDRTDQQLLKIVKLPYRPVSYSFSPTGIMDKLPTGWIFEDDLKLADNTPFPHMLRYVGTDTTLALQNQITFTSDDVNFVSPFEIAKNNSLTDYGKQVARNSAYETKLLHSDFFQQKFVYDSFDMTYNLEYLDTSDLGSQNLFVNFIISLTMSSKFMFVQTAYNNFLLRDTQNYSGIVYVARNNELPIFNSAYLNYIRTGYNYDIKTRNRQLASNVVQGSLAMVGAVASFLSSAYTGGFGVVGGISLATTGVSKIYSTIKETNQADQNIAEKMKVAEMQGLSVIGSDDVDLMTEYTYDNKAKIVVYEPSERMKQCLFDLFYYYGYIGNYQGIPNTTSRKVFNFVQAEIVLNSTPNLPQAFVDDIIQRYKEGITFLHHYTLKDNLGVDVSGWDFEQQYENWETTL